MKFSGYVVVDQRIRPQVHARLHVLTTPPPVRWVLISLYVT